MHDKNGNPTKIGTTTLPQTVLYTKIPSAEELEQIAAKDGVTPSQTPTPQRFDPENILGKLEEVNKAGKIGREQRSAQMSEKQGLAPETKLASQVGSQQLSGQNQFQQQQGKSVVGPQLQQGYTPPQAYVPQQVQQTYAGPNLPQGYTPQQQNYGQLPRPAAETRSQYQPLMPLQQEGEIFASSKPVEVQYTGLRTPVAQNFGLTKNKDIETVTKALQPVANPTALTDLIKENAIRSGGVGKFFRGAIDTDKLAIIAKGAKIDGLLKKRVAEMTKEERLQQTAHIAANYPEVYKQAKDGKQDVCDYVQRFNYTGYTVKQTLDTLTTTLKENNTPSRPMTGPVMLTEKSKSFAASVRESQNTPRAPDGGRFQF